ncbi:DMT family transporter [Salmonella enterica]|nr:DMT family transporter [Salmonella enterica]
MNKNKYSTPLLMLATILAGMLSPMQSAVNGQLGHWLQDGNACAVISFASGLVVMFFIIIARKETRQQFASSRYGIGLQDYAGRWLYFLKAHLPARWALPPFKRH